MNARPPRSDDGFVLLETLVAFLVLSIGLVTAIAAISQGSLSIRRAGAVDLAADVAREVAAVRLPALAGPGHQEGTTRGVAWRLDARALDEDARAPLLAVTIDVRPPGIARAFSFRSYAAPPRRNDP